MRKNNKGFTLVELLAVIVILAIILVIAVPQIMNTISDATKASFESSAKMVASQVENQYTVAQTLNKEFDNTGSCMEEWAGLNENDYESCTYEILEDGTAKVILKGKGKFKDLNVCDATRSSATAQGNSCLVETPAECFTFDEENGTITGYDVSCGTNVVIPSQIDGVDVVKIGSSAFYDNEISAIEIPNSVVEIGFRAFSYNPLTSVRLNNLDVQIDCETFGDPSTITTHNLPESYVNNWLCAEE